jgi:hypothetical protein
MNTRTHAWGRDSDSLPREVIICGKTCTSDAVFTPSASNLPQPLCLSGPALSKKPLLADRLMPSSQ